MPPKRPAHQRSVPNSKRPCLAELLQATTVATATEGNPLPRSPTVSLPQEQALPVPEVVPPSPPPKAPSKKRTRKYRFRGQSLFATFPQCTTTKETALSNILSEWSDTLFVIVCEEQHANEDPHLHCIVKFKSQLDIEDPHFADFIGGKHGSYEPVKAMNRAIEYVMKDKNYITHGELPKKFVTVKEKIGDSVIKAIQEGATMEMIRTGWPLYYMMHMRKIMDYYAAHTAAMMSTKLKDFPGFVVPNILTDRIGYEVATWANLNFLSPRTHKQKQLWLCGPPDCGKTHFLEQLEQYYLIYRPVKNSKYYDGFSEEIYKGMAFDEYKGQKYITCLNELLEGTTVNLEVKGSMVRKSKEKGNMPIIILSNYTPAEAYHNSTQQALAPLLSRLLVVQIEEEGYRLDLKVNTVEEEETTHSSDAESEEVDTSEELATLAANRQPTANRPEVESPEADSHSTSVDEDEPCIACEGVRCTCFE